jgi:peptidoglycan hydrolase CwlO-like protein
MKSKVILILLAIFINISITGCFNTAKPNLVNGKYYMMGDSNCALYRAKNDSQVNCYTSSDEYVGYRNAMSNQEISMYQHNQGIKQQESAQLNQSLQNLNNSIQKTNDRMNYNNQQMMNRNNVYKVQSVGPYRY